jgi:phospholipid/cholesterol/gamma-HCH transport system substrate-binding protein
MQGNIVETLIGLAVIVVAGAFFYYAATTTQNANLGGGYELVAKFDRVDGISVGSDVKLSGIKVGTVSVQELDAQTFRARLKVMIRNGVSVPEDSAIKVTNEGLLGGAYLSIAPGGSDTMLTPGAEIGSTQGAVDLIGLLSRAFLSGASSSSSETAPKPVEPATPEPATPATATETPVP